MNKEDFIKALDIQVDAFGYAYIAGDVWGDVTGTVFGDVHCVRGNVKYVGGTVDRTQVSMDPIEAP